MQKLCQLVVESGASRELLLQFFGHLQGIEVEGGNHGGDRLSERDDFLGQEGEIAPVLDAIQGKPM